MYTAQNKVANATTGYQCRFAGTPLFRNIKKYRPQYLDWKRYHKFEILYLRQSLQAHKVRTGALSSGFYLQVHFRANNFTGPTLHAVF